MQRRFMHRAALDAIERAGIGIAVFFQPALQQDHERRLAARWRPEQQQQAASDFGTGGRRLEVIDHALDRFIDAEQFIVEQLAS